MSDARPLYPEGPWCPVVLIRLCDMQLQFDRLRAQHRVLLDEWSRMRPTYATLPGGHLDYDALKRDTWAYEIYDRCAELAEDLPMLRAAI